MRGSLKNIGKDKWRIVHDLPPMIGKDGKPKRRQKKVVFNGTKAQAEAKLAEIIAQITTGVYIEDPKMTMAEYLVYWFERHKDKISYRTQLSYEETINNHLIPGLGHYKLIDLKPTHVQDYYISKKHLSSTTILYHHRILSMSLKQAVKWELIARNPADGVTPPEKDKHDGVRLSTKEVKYVLENTKDSKLHVPIALAAFLGARRGEICALSWFDINFTTKTITIRHSLGRVDGKLELGSTKTKRVRVVAMGDYLASLLGEHKKKQHEWNKDAGISSHFVCCWEDGRPLDPSYVSRGYKKILEGLGLNTASRFHDLRHNFATLTLKSKINPKIVSEMLGHENTSYYESTTEKVYAHVDVEMQREVAAFLEQEYLGAKGSKKKKTKKRAAK